VHLCVAMLVHAHINESLSIPWFLQIHVARNTDRLLLSCFTTVIVRLSVHRLPALCRRWQRVWTARGDNERREWLGGKEANGFASFSKRTIALASKLKGTSCLSAIAATWRFWDEKKVGVCPCLYIGPGLAEGVDLAWKGCGKSRKRSPNQFFKTLTP
jgi:hypothetical protein